MRRLHDRVRLHLEKKNQDVAKWAIEGRTRIMFEPGDWVWVYFRKEHFPTHCKTKLMPRRDGSFPVIERPTSMPTKFSFLQNIKTNSFQEGENDAIRISSRPFTRSQAQDLQRMEGLFMKIEVLEMVLMTSKDFYALKIAEEGTLEVLKMVLMTSKDFHALKIAEEGTFGERDPLGASSKGLGDGPSSPNAAQRDHG
ncbi:hypothetical protein KY290_016987 [Solanum tuberosum]|uniref:Integrase core domain containing protein n=1 Tax=Solanum tuberosum TaxID=4113 RepID=A0ABQ7VBL4_SOLTU|nr:hypothetical protein KY290_016987 [Solanum tuberosum]